MWKDAYGYNRQLLGLVASGPDDVDSKAILGLAMRGVGGNTWEIISNLETVWAVFGRRETAVVGPDGDRQVVAQISSAVINAMLFGE